MIDVKDRISTKVLSNGALRYDIYDENETLQRQEYIKLNDEPEEIGTPINRALFESIRNALTPAIGDIEINVSGINPSQKYPGTTWSAWGSGRVPVGVDTAQTEFNTVEKTGGNKNLQAHTHTIGGDNLYYTAGGELKAFAKEGGMSINYNTNSTGTGNSQNLQPYITCYMFKRIS